MWLALKFIKVNYHIELIIHSFSIISYSVVLFNPKPIVGVSLLVHPFLVLQLFDFQ